MRRNSTTPEIKKATPSPKRLDHEFEENTIHETFTDFEAPSSLQIDFDLEEYEKHILDTASDLKDDYSCNSSYSDDKGCTSILEDSALPTYGESAISCLEEEVPFDEPPLFQ